MTAEEKIKYWIELSDYDLETAGHMLNTKRYLYVGFMCHQTIEKILKAYYVKIKNETPPYTHNLRHLAELSGIFSLFLEEHKMFINELMPLNIEARYPSYKEKLLKSLNHERCTGILSNTKQLKSWIEKKL